MRKVYIFSIGKSQVPNRISTIFGSQVQKIDIKKFFFKMDKKINTKMKMNILIFFFIKVIYSK